MILHSAKNLLEINGIDCFIKNEFASSNGGNLGINNIWVELWVRNSAEAARAETLLEAEVTHTSAQPEWFCRECGEENDGGFEICWNCQVPAVLS